VVPQLCAGATITNTSVGAAAAAAAAGVPAEARLLESEQRSMLARVSDQLESERRAALAAGRRRVEREVGQVLAGEQPALLAQQQVRYRMARMARSWGCALKGG
jgi:hypothetical protein